MDNGNKRKSLSTEERNNLKRKLSATIYDKRMSRKTTNAKDKELSNNLAMMGIDSSQLKNDLENLNREKGFTITK